MAPARKKYLLSRTRQSHQLSWNLNYVLVLELELELELELVELESTGVLTFNEPSAPAAKGLLGRACALTLAFASALAFGRVCKNAASAAGASANCCKMPSFHRRGGITKTETA